MLHSSAVLFDAVKYAGVAYLLWMAWQVLQERGALRIEADSTPRSSLRVFRDGIALNLLNPKLSMFFAAFLPQFIEPHSPDALHLMLLMSVAFMVLTFIVFATYGAFAAALRDKVLASSSVMAWMRRSFAAAFAVLAARLAVTDR